MTNLKQNTDLKIETKVDSGLIALHLDILEKIASTLDQEEVLKRIVEAAVYLSDADEGSLLLVDEHSGELYMRAAKGFGDEYASTFRQLVNKDNVAGQVILTGKPVLLNPTDSTRKQIKVKTNYLPNSVLNLPIKRDGITYGVLGVYNVAGQQPFSHHHMLMLMPLANYAAIAISNARRYQKTEQLLGDSYALFDIAALLTETHNLQSLLDYIASQVLFRLEAAKRVSIHLMNEFSNRLEAKASIPGSDSVDSYKNEAKDFESGQGIAGKVHQENRLIYISDVTQEANFINRNITSGSLLVAPISRRDTCIGTISVYSPTVNAFTHRHHRFLVSLSGLANVAIENAKLFAQEKNRATQLWVVAQLAEKLNSILNLDELLHQTVNLIHTTFKFDDVAIKILDKKAGGLVFKAAAGLRSAKFGSEHIQQLDEGLAGYAARTGETVWANDVKKDPRYISPWFSDTNSELDIPLKHHGYVIGVLDVQSQSFNAFSTHDILALETLSNQIAVAIQNANLYNELTQLIQESQERYEVVQRRNKELQSLRDILGALQSTLSFSQVLTQIASGVVTGLNYQVVMLSTVDEHRQFLTVQEVSFETPTMSDLLKKGEKLVGQVLLGNHIELSEQDDNLALAVCRDGQPRVTAQLHDLFKPVVNQELCVQIQRLFQLETFAVLPIKAGEQLLGVLYAGTIRSKILASDLEALQAFANQAALAVINARQFESVHERLRRRVKELQTLVNIDRLISDTTDPQTIFNNILDISLKLVGAEFGHIILVHKETGALIPKVSHPPESISIAESQLGLVSWVAQRRETERISDMSSVHWVGARQEKIVQSALAAPILIGQDLVGIISMESTRSGAFTEEDESLLGILATQTAVAIKTVNYYHELEESRRLSIETERIAAMGDIASNMVHNMNNSVGGIRVLVQQIRQKMKQNTLTDDYLNQRLTLIEQSAEKTLDMARAIRNPFQILAAELIDVNAHINTVLQTFEPLPKQVKVLLNLDPNLPSVMATHQLKEVFRNLINNALEAMKGNGSLEISSRETNLALIITVADTGPGLAPNLNANSIFKLGISHKQDGLGYGLWWCKIYLNRIGGTIELDATVTVGCKFVVTLPLKK